MLSRENNDLLTLTGPGTPGGNLFRRYWLPACLSAELPECEGPPVRFKLLGEDLVAYCDRDGNVGLIGAFCPHRGVDLYFGRNEDGGLRCLYHGWLMNAEGRVLDAPAEPDPSVICKDARHTAYPTHEIAGVVFTYMGPPEKKPLFPAYRFTQIPDNHTYVTKSFQECNYLQGLEGECDSAHLSFLHRALRGPLAKRAIFTSRAPTYDYERTDFGLRLIATRVTEDDRLYVRVSSFVMPYSCWVPARNRETHMHVPIDDTHSWRFDLGVLDAPLSDIPSIDDRGEFLDENFHKIPNRSNDYLQDRELQKLDNFTGMKGFLAQDSCVTESMGPRVDRAREYLGQSDAGIVAVRNMLLKGIRDLEKGIDPPHTIVEENANLFTHIDACQVTIDQDADWRAALPHVAGPTAIPGLETPPFRDPDRALKRETGS
jgi:nitrite reductase/ring-hydroxylating ferredoxin subunit